MRMNYIFPIGFLFNSMAMTGLLILLVLLGEKSLAADVGIVQAVTLALFHSFSGNARSLIFHNTAPKKASAIVYARVLLLFPLSGIAYILAVKTSGVEAWLAGTLIFRRGTEWLSEVHATEIEREHNLAAAWVYLVVQIASFLMAVVLVILGLEPWEAFLVWGVAPIFLGARFFYKSIYTRASLVELGSGMLPHIGSTSISGIGVYVFRLLLSITLGKEASGELFAAFAVGGVVGTVFANVLGPSLIMHEQGAVKTYRNRWPLYFLIAYLLIGLGISIESIRGAADGWVAHSSMFWLAVGLSMCGAVVMVYAQRIRLAFIQRGHSDRNMFGPDVLANIFVIGAIPFLVYWGGFRLLAALYLLHSVVLLLLYSSAATSTLRVRGSGGVKCKPWLALLMILPIFFQSGSLFFHSDQIHFDTGGSLANLPLPFSVVACYVGLLFLGNYTKAYVSLTFVFATFALMVFSSLITFQNAVLLNEAKLILLVQFILPMFAFVFGQMYEGWGAEKGRGERQLFWGALSLMLIHIVASWTQGSIVLVPDLYFFSMYQYREYVPVILVAALLIGYFSVLSHGRQKRMMPLVALVVGMYIGASILPIFIFLFVGIFLLFYWRRCQLPQRNLLLIFPVGSLVAITYISVGLIGDVGSTNGLRHWDIVHDMQRYQGDMQSAWRYYAQGVFYDLKSLVFGHLIRPPRAEYPSAYNYYLNVLYNFGLIALLPFLFVLFYTARLQALATRRLMYCEPQMLVISASMIYFLLGQSFISVVLQQPYPAIFIFFLWGGYLSRLIDGHMRTCQSAKR